MARDCKLSHLQSLRGSVDISKDDATRHEESPPPAAALPRGGGGLPRGRRGRRGRRLHLAPLRMRPRVPLLVLAGEARHEVAVIVIKQESRLACMATDFAFAKDYTEIG